MKHNLVVMAVLPVKCETWFDCDGSVTCEM